MSYITVDLLEHDVYEVLTSTVGQYIPKEGFYEGDILCGEETDEYGSLLSKWYGVVRHDETTGRIRIEDDCGDWYETDDFTYSEVIGNIHDSPKQESDHVEMFE